MSAERPAGLVSASDLQTRLGDPRLRIADVRWYLGEPLRGRSEYEAGHIPGAVFVDLDRDLAAASGPGRHPLPDPVAFAGRMGELGFGDEHSIVVYDASGGTVAARLWWMLDRLGRDVALLDGGLASWTAAGGGLTSELPTHAPATLTPATEWSGIVDRETLAADATSVDLVDVRAPERYHGEVEPVDRVPGHIPGARNRPATTLLDDQGRLRPPEELRVLLTAEDGVPGTPMIMSCGSGVTACLGILAARVAGLPEPLLYPGSYSDWSAAHMPIASGGATEP